MTMSLLRYYADGRLVVAGAHQTIVVCRAATGKCERFAPQGTWLGLVDDIGAVTEDRAFTLNDGDVLVLFTDGITEATPVETEEQFGLDRLCGVVETHCTGKVDEIRDQVLETLTQWSSKRQQDDDVTLLVLRHTGLARAVAA